MVFLIIGSKIVKMAGSITKTMVMESKVPRPINTPMSAIRGFEVVPDSVKPAVAMVAAEIKIERKELPSALCTASFFCMVRRFLI